MNITKFGHSCLLIEDVGVRLLTDPGDWNAEPDAADLDAVLITHEHGDHCDLPQLKSILAKNPQAKVITHESVGKLLDAEGIVYSPIRDGETLMVQEVSIRSCGTAHEIIYEDFPKCQNTGYLIAEKLFLPGDALHDFPDTPVEILGLPVGGPWMRLSEGIEYAKKLAPKTVFPIHDAMYVDSYRDKLIPRIVGGNIEAAGMRYEDLKAGDTKAF